MDATDGDLKEEASPSAGELLNNDGTSSTSLDPGWRDVFNQVIATSICALTVVQVGLNMSYSAVLLPKLEEPSSGYTLSKDEESWIASLLVISTPIGSLLSGPVTDKIGRKKGNLLTCLPVFIAWSIFVFTPKNNLLGLYIARVLAGLGGGMTTTFLVYVSEISHEKFRPMLLGLNSSAVSLGVLLITACGVYMHWRLMAACYAVLALITFILIWMFTPESPHWLAMLSSNSNSRSEAEKALRWLNPKEEIFQKKLQQILTASRKVEEVRCQKSEQNFLKKIKILLINFTLRETLLPVLILMGLILFQQLSGGYSIIFYTIHIFKKMGGRFGGGINEYDALQMMGIVRFLMSVLSAGLSRVVGRRALLFTSSIGMAVSCFMITLYQNYFNYSTVPNELNSTIAITVSSVLQNKTGSTSLLMNEQTDGHWFPMVCILLFVCMSAIGLLNVPWTMMGELLPMSTRGVGTGFLISYAYVMMFVTVKIYPFVLDSISIGSLFLIQGIVCVMTVIFTFIFVPETLGKSLSEIEYYFSRKK